ncbi:MAG: Zn-ribbon domain-containing OB-fold protein [Chloroflexi bacterium]|nr:Zn-ribbon domain-containing OB-fold protein [Chloroflexota bacterium]
MEITSAAFQQLLNQKKLMGSKCKKCGAIHLPPRPLCPECGGSDVEWTALKGKGKLVAFTTIHVGPTLMTQAGYDRKNPYCSGIVQLDEGPKVSARILNVEAQNPVGIKVGTPVTIDFVEQGQGESKRTFLAFRA